MDSARLERVKQRDRVFVTEIVANSSELGVGKLLESDDQVGLRHVHPHVAFRGENQASVDTHSWLDVDQFRRGCHHLLLAVALKHYSFEINFFFAPKIKFF